MAVLWQRILLIMACRHSSNKTPIATQAWHAMQVGRSLEQAAFRAAMARASDCGLMRLPSMAACFSFLLIVTTHQVEKKLEQAQSH